MAEKRIALVTGGAQGIGLACAKALSDDGFALVLADINGDGVTEAAKTIGASGVACDMGKPEEVAALFDRIEKDHGPLSVLVNNAGIASPGDFLNYDLEVFQQVIAVNLTGTFLAIQHAAKSMIAAGLPGAIVNMSSINAQVAIPAIPAYCASKGGVMQLTKSAALALAPHNIRVNAVGPGSIDTAMMAGVNADPTAMARVMSRTPHRQGWRGQRSCRCGRLSGLRQGKLRHRRDHLCGRRTPGSELHSLNQPLRAGAPTRRLFYDRSDQPLIHEFTRSSLSAIHSSATSCGSRLFSNISTIQPLISSPVN